jgi:hypothetical protein
MDWHDCASFQANPREYHFSAFFPGQFMTDQNGVASAQQTVPHPVLDGGGAKGFTRLECSRKLKRCSRKICVNHFELIFGTSTGAIIAALLSLGYTVDGFHSLYREHVPTIIEQNSERAMQGPGQAGK